MVESIVKSRDILKYRELILNRSMRFFLWLCFRDDAQFYARIVVMVFSLLTIYKLCWTLFHCPFSTTQSFTISLHIFKPTQMKMLACGTVFSDHPVLSGRLSKSRNC